MKYKLFRACLSVIFISCLFFYSGCINECDGEEDEPTLYINFATARNYTRVYGLYGKEKNTYDYPSSQWSVPMSIKDDSTIVVFESNSRIDTLTIHYSRTVRMESQRCGFRIFFDDFEIVEPTTFTRLPDLSDDIDYSNDLYVYIDE
jgi:hypothetical protein